MDKAHLAPVDVLMLILRVEFRFGEVAKVLIIGAVDATAVHVLLVDPQYGAVPYVSILSTKNASIREKK